MKFPSSLLAVLLTAVMIASGGRTAAAADDASIDRLLNKLPAPEKVAKLQAGQTDPVMRDPIAQDIGKALSQRNASRALKLSRRLTERYPKSPLAHCIRGAIASAERKYPEATAAYRRTLDIQPKFFLRLFAARRTRSRSRSFRRGHAIFSEAGGARTESADRLGLSERLFGKNWAATGKPSIRKARHGGRADRRGNLAAIGACGKCAGAYRKCTARYCACAKAHATTGKALSFAGNFSLEIS